ncbi:MAG: response regulator transcription factor [Planctomycetota bacterium]|jgi:DNA-binding response OmpR family regulator
MAAKKKPVVLCVDDDIGIRESLKAVLEANDFEVVEADCARAGLEQYEAISPDVVVADLMMETVDAGIEFCKNMARHQHKARVYMLSSIGSELMNNVNHRELGIDGVFDKPVKPERLLAAINTAVGREVE